MTFMKKDVNFGLLVLIIVSILLFSGFSVYYQTTFKDVSLEYGEKLEQLSDVTNQLSSKRQELNETYTLRIKAETDKKKRYVNYEQLQEIAARDVPIIPIYHWYLAYAYRDSITGFAHRINYQPTLDEIKIVK